MRNICEAYTDLQIQRKSFASGIQTMKEAIKQVAKSTEQLTPCHCQFIKLCLLSKCYHLAVPLLQIDIFEVEPKGTKTTDYMSYFYYGGMIYIGVKEYARALHFFKLAFTLPASVASLIMVESYKKFILVSLIHNGNIPPFPDLEGLVIRQIKNHCSHYIQLSEIFATKDVVQLQQFCESNREIFIQDKNLGLLNQVANSLYEKLILMYTKCYVTLSLEDIAKGVKLNSAEVAEKYMLRMIEQGKICAVINLQDGKFFFCTINFYPFLIDFCF